MTSAPPQHSPDGQWWWDGQQWQPTQPPPPPQSTDGKAIASLVTGLFWFWGLGSLAAVILGHQSRSDAKKQNRQPSGLALAGLVLGYVGIVGAAVLTSLLVWGLSSVDGTVRAAAVSADAEIEARAVSAAERNYFMAEAPTPRR